MQVRRSDISKIVGLILAGSTAASAVTLDPLYSNGFESGLIAFGPAFSALPDNASSVPSSADPLTVTLDQPAGSPTFVSIVSSDPIVQAVGGGVTVPMGQSSAAVLLNGSGYSATPVVLRATLGNTIGASVRAEKSLNETNLGDEADFCSIESPNTFDVFAGAATPTLLGLLFEFGVTNPVGAPVGWRAEAGYGTVGTDPRLLTGWHFAAAGYSNQVVDSDEFQASLIAPQTPGNYSYTFRYTHDDGGSWTYCDLNGAGSGGGLNFETGQLASMVVHRPYEGLVINELDYDNVGSPDTAEFVEIYNKGPLPIDLSHVSITFINGASNIEYRRVSLAPMGTIAVGQYGVYGRSVVTNALSPSVLTVTDDSANDLIQNGAPDGLALIDDTQPILIDALSYEGSITAAVIPGFPAPVTLVEGTVLSAVDGTTIQGDLQRLPNGTDMDNAATDWAFNAVPSPGAANQP